MPKRFPAESITYANYMSQWQKTPAYDPTIRLPFASGDESSRPMFTSLRYTISFTLQWLTLAEVETIEEHQEHVVIGASRFEIREAYTGDDWEVTYARPIMVMQEAEDVRRFRVQIELTGKRVEKMRTTQIDVEDLGAGSDIADRPIFYNPKAVTINSIAILTKGAPAGVDNSNTSVILIEDDASNQVVSKTYNTATQPPSSDGEDLGAVTNGSLAAGEHLLLSVTNGTTANLPAFTLIIEWYYTT